MIINYAIYNVRANMVVERDLESFEEAIRLAASMPEWCIPVNTLEGRQDFQYTPEWFLEGLED